MIGGLILDFVRSLVDHPETPLEIIGAIKRMAEGAEAKRVSEIRPVEGAPIIDATIARLRAQADEPRPDDTQPSVSTDPEK